MFSADTDAVYELVTRVCVQVVAFSDIDTWDDAEAFFEAGGMGLVHKTSPLDDLAKAIEAAANKQKWIAPALRTIDPTPISKSTDSELTKRESEIVTLITKGLTSKQIAEQLCLSINTVESHRKSVFRKLKVRHCAQLVHYALTSGLDDQPSRS